MILKEIFISRRFSIDPLRPPRASSAGLAQGVLLEKRRKQTHQAEPEKSKDDHES
jgi:hypothetical protein